MRKIFFSNYHLSSLPSGKIFLLLSGFWGLTSVMSLVCHVCRNKIKTFTYSFLIFLVRKVEKVAVMSECSGKCLQPAEVGHRRRLHTDLHPPSDAIHRPHRLLAEPNSQTIILSHNRVSRQVLYNYIISLSSSFLSFLLLLLSLL